MTQLMNVVDIGDMDYDGSQLHHAFAYKRKGVLGPTISFFVGSANVKEHLVDLEDSLANDFIKSALMVHFIIEMPGVGIREAVVWQRFFIQMIAKFLENNIENLTVDVDGDDLIVEDQKLSVSIATLSSFSALIHVGINIHVGKECPVPAIGLSDFGGLNGFSTDSDWAFAVAHMFATEYSDIINATYKVIGVN